jgi:hypothetical protein
MAVEFLSSSEKKGKLPSFSCLDIERLFAALEASSADKQTMTPVLKKLHQKFKI